MTRHSINLIGQKMLRHDPPYALFDHATGNAWPAAA